jgi:NADH:ubiquinone oxidoreductase subunit B-like Fe-S oxidoreductase
LLLQLHLFFDLKLTIPKTCNLATEKVVTFEKTDSLFRLNVSINCCRVLIKHNYKCEEEIKYTKTLQAVKSSTFLEITQIKTMAKICINTFEKVVREGF